MVLAFKNRQSVLLSVVANIAKKFSNTVADNA
jgi:hypothetical protein